MNLKETQVEETHTKNNDIGTVIVDPLIDNREYSLSKFYVTNL